MLGGYREIYGLNKYIEEIKNEVSDLDVKVYAIIPFAVSFVEIETSSKEHLKHLDLEFTSRIISFCERNHIEDHFFNPLELL